MKNCSYKGCNRKFWAKGFCNIHLYRHNNGSDMDAPILQRRKPLGGYCKVSDCNRKHCAKGYCTVHYSRVKNNKELNAPIRKTNTNTSNCCLYCGLIYRVRPSLQKRSKFCSRSCRAKSRTKDKNPNWRGGITDSDMAERNKFAREVRDLIFQRDNYACTFCSSGGLLHVDHIKEWAKYPELRFDYDNCRTLCTACHYFITFKRKMPKGTVWGIKSKFKRITS